MTEGENMLESATAVAMAEVRRQLDGQPIPGVPAAVNSWSAEGGSIDFSLITRAVMDELWSRIDLALLDFDADGDDSFGRGHEHAKSVVREILRTASIPNEEGEGK